VATALCVPLDVELREGYKMGLAIPYSYQSYYSLNRSNVAQSGFVDLSAIGSK